MTRVITSTKKRAKTCTRYDQGVNTKNPELHSGSKPAPNQKNNGTHIYEMNDQLVHEIHTQTITNESIYIRAHPHTHQHTLAYRRSVLEPAPCSTKYSLTTAGCTQLPPILYLLQVTNWQSSGIPLLRDAVRR